jgi:hypothetical protein
MSDPKTPSFGQLEHLDELNPPNKRDTDEHPNSYDEPPDSTESYENGGGKIPVLLKKGATDEEVVHAVNGIAIEMQLVRQAISSIGSRVGTHEETVKATLGLIEKSILNRLSGIETILRPVLKAKVKGRKPTKKGK